MPNRDGTGPVSTTGRMGEGRGLGRANSQGSQTCACTACDYTEEHARGAKCTEKVCPKCGAAMKGEYCK